MRIKKLHIIFFALAISVFLHSCALKMAIKPNDRLVWNYKLNIVDTLNNLKDKNLKENVMPLLKPLPNKHTPGMNFKAKYTEKYGVRIDTKSQKYGLFNIKPVVNDKVSINRNKVILEKSMNSRGYFNSKVIDTLIKHKHLKDEISFTIFPSERYIIKDIKYHCDDTAILNLITKENPTIYFTKNAPLIYYQGSLEKYRIENIMKLKGYYLADKLNLEVMYDTFSRSDILNPGLNFDEKLIKNRKSRLPNDTALNNKMALVDVYILNKKNSDTISKYYFSNQKVVLTSLNNKKFQSYTFHTFDTINKVVFERHTDALSMNFLKDYFKLNEDKLYNEKDILKLYNKLQSLQLFDNLTNAQINILDSNKLEAIWNLNLGMKKNLGYSFQVYESALGAGSSANITFTNKNLFNLGAKFNFTPYAILDYIVPNSTVRFNFKNLDSLNQNFRFGANTSLSYPKLLLPFKLKNGDITNGTSNIQFGFSRNIRTDFFKFNNYVTMLGYSFKNKRNYFFNIVPFFTDITDYSYLSDAFKSILNSNFYLRKSYSDAFIMGEKIMVNYTDENILYKKFVKNITISSEEGGGLLRLVNRLDSSLFENKTYNSYLKFDMTLKGTFIFKNSDWANRFLIGAGIPLKNNNTLPFVKQYIIGGNYDLRGFAVRGVGPGTFYDSTGTSIFQSGDIKFVFNSEYQFNLFNYSSFDFKGAFFMDIGNIWLYKNISSLPNSQFKFNTFYRDLAMSPGVGLRINIMNAIVLRLDYATKVKIPYNTNNTNGWVDFSSNGTFIKNYISNSRAIIAIGYAF